MGPTRPATAVDDRIGRVEFGRTALAKRNGGDFMPRVASPKSIAKRSAQLAASGPRIVVNAMPPLTDD
jgi:hypothetical protein